MMLVMLRGLRDLGVTLALLVWMGLYVSWQVLNGWEHDWKAQAW